MKLEQLRWLLLPTAAAGLLLALVRGATPGRMALVAGCVLGWYLLSRRKARSLDRDRLPPRR